MDKLIYLSPHLDDAVLSCGGIIWQQVHQEKIKVEIWTVFSGDPPAGELSPFALELHQRWQTGEGAPAARRDEDRRACTNLGCLPRYLDFPDCIYRSNPSDGQPRIEKNDDLFAFDPGLDGQMVDDVNGSLRAKISGPSLLVVPLGVGDHIDHRITRLAAEKLGRPLWYFADFPYAGDRPNEVEKQANGLHEAARFPVNGAGLEAWQSAVAAYGSQISSFWVSNEDMKQALHRYAHSQYGSVLWSSGAG